MKTNRIKNQNYKLFKYNLLKLQVYSNKSFSITSDFSISIIEQIEAYLKQALKIIFEYHV
jgi:ribulose bisphosphate carboxylase small subunit